MRLGKSIAICRVRQAADISSRKRHYLHESSLFPVTECPIFFRSLPWANSADGDLFVEVLTGLRMTPQRIYAIPAPIFGIRGAAACDGLHRLSALIARTGTLYSFQSEFALDVWEHRMDGSRIHCNGQMHHVSRCFCYGFHFQRVRLKRALTPSASRTNLQLTRGAPTEG